MKGKNTLALAALFGAMLCWSSVPLFLKYFTHSLDAWTVNGIRYSFAALLLLPAVFRHRRDPFPPGRNIWKDALIPTLVNTLGQVGWALAPYFLTASVMGFGIRSAFFFTLLGSLWLLPEERYLLRAPLFWVGGGICAIGIAALFSSSFLHGLSSARGCAILLATAIIWGFYGITVRRYMSGYSPHRSFGVICLYTALCLAILMFAYGDVRTLGTLGAGPLALLLVSAVFGIACAHVLMYYAIHHLGPVIEGGAEFVTPFLTFAGAAALFGERLSVWQWMGGLGVIAGSLFMIRSHHAFAAPKEES